eukprot:TRINITY_DN1221_c0_g1_i1.p2 TRINITY_DN1221_c0_g1~~TRINITY_DN1221_c0_g1_i1.p2  ORF type:complete len:60 (-),score=13.29 TRINITY_DN1221_c0_g1_i1:252-431(-)
MPFDPSNFAVKPTLFRGITSTSFECLKSLVALKYRFQLLVDETDPVETYAPSYDPNPFL